ncbi:MAG: protein kinase domain-containing protein [Gallintestinimicrobium sp.]
MRNGTFSGGSTHSGKLQNTPNIVSVQNYFRENNTAYFVMEYVNGTSLKAYLAARGKNFLRRSIKILPPVMNALVSVHSMQLLHRDISRTTFT